MRIFKLAHQLTTLAFVNGKNNGFTIIDKKTHFSIFNRFNFLSSFCQGENFVGGAFEDCPVSGKIKKMRDKPSASFIRR